jgi:hypothetical protein
MIDGLLKDSSSWRAQVEESEAAIKDGTLGDSVDGATLRDLLLRQ